MIVTANWSINVVATDWILCSTRWRLAGCFRNGTYPVSSALSDGQKCVYFCGGEDTRTHLPPLTYQHDDSLSTQQQHSGAVFAGSPGCEKKTGLDVLHSANKYLKWQPTNRTADGEEFPILNVGKCMRNVAAGCCPGECQPGRTVWPNVAAGNVL